jgi:hypothetical protein
VLARFIPLCLVTLAAPEILHGQRLSPLAPEPNWAELEAFHETITREDFAQLLNEIYAPNKAAAGLIEVRMDVAVIRTRLAPAATMELRFARDHASARPVPRFWRPAGELGLKSEAQPLAGIKVALDPGHLGGEWARIEERWLRIGETVPVTEGDMTLRVAELMEPQLSALGAEVLRVRRDAGPTTPQRPEHFREIARAEMARQGNRKPRENYTSLDDPRRGETVQALSELFFYRTAEIRHRGELVNQTLKPDITICLHFNAEAWGDPQKPELVPRNHLHALINGCYSAGELRNDDVRFEMLMKLLNRCFPEELTASERVVEALAEATGLPPFHYPTSNALRVGSSPFVWARNLLANRLYRSPVVFLEPYVMNSAPVWERVQLGDYEGERLVGGEMRKSIYREYADAVVEGLRRHYATARKAQQ